MVVNLPFTIFFLLLFAAKSGSVFGQNPDDVEWKGNKRAIVLDDLNPLGKKPNLTWSRGWMCGWTPHGLCFSPDRKKDINRFYMIPFQNVKSHVYCDQKPNLNSGWGFGINSIILAHFSRSAKKDDFWRGLVRSYTQNGYRQVLKLTARTFYKSLGANQIQETFYPSQVLLEGAHDACKFFKTDCLPSEYCVPRVLSGIVWPGEYKCVCRKGWQQVRGRGCVDIDECNTKSPCKWWAVCVNTLGSYSCHCPTGYKGAQCDVDVDECQMKPCPDKSVCKNTPGSFNCTCLPGFSGKDCTEYSEFGSSSNNDPIITFQVVKKHAVKEISIPRKKPANIIRKAVHISDPGYKEIAIMGSLILVLNVLGVYLYWWQKRKQARSMKRKKEKQNKELENDGDISTSQVLAEEETISSSEVLGDLDKESNPSSQLMIDKGAILSSTFLDKETVANNQLLENNTTKSSQSLKNNGTILSEKAFTSSEVLIDEETSGKSQKLENIAFPSRQALKKKGSIQIDTTGSRDTTCISGCQVLVERKTIRNSQTLENNTIVSSGALEDNGIISNDAIHNRETVSCSPIFTDKETKGNSQSLESYTAGSNQSLLNERAIIINNDASSKSRATMTRSQLLDEGEPTTRPESLVNKPIASDNLLEKEDVLRKHSLDRESVIGSELLNKEVVISDPSMSEHTSLYSHPAMMAKRAERSQVIRKWLTAGSRRTRSSKRTAFLSQRRIVSMES